MNSFLFRQIAKYFKWHYSLFFKLFSYAIAKTSRNVFCFLFNTSALIRGKKVRFSYNADLKSYQVTDSPYQLRFYHVKQANMAYVNGVESRGQTLGDAYFLNLIKFRPDDVVIDCGANVGDLYLYFRVNGLNVKYTGFEPSPLEYKSLSSNVEPQKSYNLGLWHENGNLKFYVSSQGADSSLIEPVTYDQVINVETKRLDSLLSGPVRLLKIEAEGAEPEVLLGCANLLRNVDYISADLGFERGKEQASTLETVINYLLGQNFELVTVSHTRVIALFRNKNLSAG